MEELEKLKIDINPDIDIWQQYYQAFFSNSALLGNSLADETLTVDASPLNPRIRALLLEMGDEPLIELFRFLGDHQEFFDAYPEQLAYRKIRVTCHSKKTEDAVNTLAILANHLSEKKYFPFEEIILKMPSFDHENTDKAFEKLKVIMDTLKYYPQVKKINILHQDSDESQELTVDQYLQITQIVRENARTVAFGFHHVTAEKKIDLDERRDARNLLANELSKNIRNANIARRLNTTQKVPELKSNKNKKTVPFVALKSDGVIRAVKLGNAKKMLSVDIATQVEQQHQLQTQVQQETQQETQIQAQEQNEINADTAHSNAKLIDRKKYVDLANRESANILKAGKLQCTTLDENTFKLANPNPSLYFLELWEKFVGKKELENSICYLTETAMAKIHALPQYFLGGLNFDNLPPGFFIQQHTDRKYILCYDATKLIENKNQSKLTPILKSRPQFEPWLGDWRQFCPDESNVNIVSTFNGLTDKDGVPDYRGLSTVKLHLIMEALNPTLSSEIKENHHWFFDKYIQHNASFTLSAFFDILYREGCEGLDALLNCLKKLYGRDTGLCDSIVNDFIAHNFQSKENNNYSFVGDLISAENLLLLEKLADFTDAQINWWKQIAKSQFQAVGYVDFSALFNGFTYFLSRLPSSVVLPYECPIVGENPLVQLDRLLGLLGKVDAAHLNEQMDNLTSYLFTQKEKDLLDSNIKELGERIAGFQNTINSVMRRIFNDEKDTRDYIISRLNVISELVRPIADDKIREHLDFLDSALGGMRFEADIETILESLNQIEKKVHEIQTIDLSSEGAWYAARWDNYHYFHPKMHLEAQSVDAEKNFKVTFQDLLEVARDADYLEMEISFHRFVGQSDHIAAPYQKYVDLTNDLNRLDFRTHHKTILLACLAKVTTGPRGSKEFDTKPLFDFLQLALGKSTSSALIILQISQKLDRMPNKPTISELCALIVIACETSATEDVTTLTSENPSEKVLQSWKLWQQNENHLGANDFLYLYEALRKKDKEQFDQWSRISALLKKGDQDTQKRDELVELVDDLKKHSHYEMILKILATIHIEKTGSDNLPTLDQLISLLNKRKLTDSGDLTSEQAVFAFVTSELPACVFDRASNDVAPLDGELLREHIDAFNVKLESYGAPPLDVDEFEKDRAGYLSGLYAGLMKRLPEFLSARMQQEMDSLLVKMAINPAKQAINKLVFPAVTSLFLAPLEKHTKVFPALNKLKNIYPEPAAVTVNSEKLIGLEELQNYTASLEGLFSVLVDLKKSWGEKFNVDNIINSPIQYSPKQLQSIFEAIKKQNYSSIPTQLLETIFPKKGQLPEGTDLEGLAFQISKIIAIDGLSLKQKSQMIALLNKQGPSSLIHDVVNHLAIVKNQHAAIPQSFFTVMLNVLNNKHPEIIKNINELLLLPFEKNDAILTILFNTFSNESSDFFIQFKKSYKNTRNLPDEEIKNEMRFALLQDFDFLLNAVNNFNDADKIKFLKIISFGCLHKNYDLTEDVRDGYFKIINKLSTLYHDDKGHFDAIATLYDKIPRPSLSSLKKLIEDKSFIEKYELDPSGERLIPGKLHQQFNIDKIHERIDSILDLGRDKQEGRAVALFHNDREKLYDAIGYVTAVGKDYPITVPGMQEGKEKYQKPVLQLTPGEIKALIQHYRSVISGEISVSKKMLWVAQCELMALLREALYRTHPENAMAYDTQIVSVLNTMLHGGNVFSEIRTGEGKSIITAMMAVAKWAQGGAIDVASSNMALAKRDWEENKDFYDYLGIETGLIHASSENKKYKHDGIHYSDISELTLWQEQQLLFGEKLPDKVSLIADEVDFNVLDNTTQFRYATSLDEVFDPHYNPYEKLYPSILNFVRNDNLFLKVMCSAKQDILNLKNYILSDSCTLPNSLKMKIINLPELILDRWINSAYIATKLIADEDYVIRTGKINKNGEEIETSEAQVKINGRANPQSRFSDGVQQFLNTLLNEKMEKDKQFKKLCNGNQFIIEPEKTYLASRSAKNTIDYYLRSESGKNPRGNVIGLTGTLGTFEDRMELFKNYAAKFFRMPPHKPLLRDPMPPMVATIDFFTSRTPELMQQAHFNAIYKDIKRAQKLGQAILIICESVAFSDALNKFLIAKNSDTEKLQLHNGEQIGQDEASVTKKAGEPGMVTISTLMFGRGTDIKLKERNGNGLHVITTYISGEREYGQNIGRAGRNGAKGSDQLIIAESEFTKRGKKTPSSISELKLAIKDIREEIDKNKTADRFERQLYSDVKDQFFKQYTQLSAELKKQFEGDAGRVWKIASYRNHVQWEGFLRSIDQKWNDLLADLRNEMKAKMKSKIQEIAKLPQSKRRPLLDALPHEMAKLEKTKLLEKIEMLVKFGNENWSATVEDIKTQSLSELTKIAHDESSDSESFSPILGVPLAFNVTPVSHTLPDAVVLAQPLNMVISADKLAVPLKPSEMQPLNAYLKCVENSELKKTEKYEALQAQLLQRSIDAIHKRKLFKKNITPNLEKGEIYYTLLYLGEEHYRLSKLNACNYAQQRAIFELIRTVARNGIVKDKDQIVEALSNIRSVAFDDIKNKERGDYLLRFMAFTKFAKELNFDIEVTLTLPPLPEESMNSEDLVWGLVYDFASKAIQDDYLSAFVFKKSQDRLEAAENFKKSLVEINESVKLKTHSEKISALISLLQKTTQSIADSDLTVDKTSFFKRNKSGSRLQTTLNNIMSLALSRIPAQKLTDDNLSKIKEVLAIINGRASYSEIDLRYQLPSNDVTIDHLLVLRDRLKKDIAQLEIKKDNYFWNRNTAGLLHLLKTAFKQIDMLCISHSLTIEKKSVRDKLVLQQTLQENLQLLASAPVAKDYLDQHRIDVMERHYEAVRGFPIAINEAQKLLLQKAMFEIERIMTPKEGDSEFSFKNVAYDGEHVLFIADFSQNGVKKELQITFDHFYPGSERVICSFVAVETRFIASPVPPTKTR